MKHTYISKTNTTKSIIKLKPKSKVFILEFNISLVNALYGWRLSLHRMPSNALWHATHQDYSKLVKERKLVERWKSGGILNYIEKVLQVKFLQFGNRFSINHTKKKLILQRKVMNTNLHTMKVKKCSMNLHLGKKKHSCKLWNRNIEPKCIRIIFRSKNHRITIVNHLTTIFQPIISCKFLRCSLGVSLQHKSLVLSQAQ